MGEDGTDTVVHTHSGNDRLIIVGSGNIALNIYKIAEMLEYCVIVIDHRTETLTRERFPHASELMLGNIVDLLKTCEISETTSIVLATHNHEYDAPALQAVIQSSARYIGVLGNKRKVTTYFNALNSMGISEELISRVHIPIGLDIGGQLAAEIALAAVAEIQAVKYKRSGGFITVKQINRETEKHDEFF